MHVTDLSLNIRLETANKLLWYYQYINHPKQTIFFLKQDVRPQRDPALRQKDVAVYLAYMIKTELAGVVQKVDASHCSAEHVLLLVQEAVHRFRYLANDPEELLEVEYEILDKRVRIAQRSTTPKGKQRDTISLCCKERLSHQQTLEMERNKLICKIKSCSRSVSPEAARSPSSDRSTGSKRRMKQAGGLFYERETANLLEDSSFTPHVFDYISVRSFAKNRLRGKERMEFPTLHRALLFGTEQEARSWAPWLESNDKNVELVDFFRRNVSHVAAEVGRVYLLIAFLRKSLDTADAFGLTPLMIAVLYGHLACCKLLINAKFDRHVRDSSGRNLLSLACKRRHLRIVKYLINELEFQPYDDRGRCICSPIHDAIESGDLQICTFLIQSGVSVYQPFNDKTPRDLAMEKGQTPILQLIDEEITRLGWSQVDAVSAHLGYQHGLNLQYSIGDNVGHQMSQQYVHDSQTHDATSHSSNIPLYPSTAASTQYMDPSQLGHTWN
jgi:Ankyrin repeats (3 copies)